LIHYTVHKKSQINLEELSITYVQKCHFFSLNKLNKFIKAHKDRLPNSSKRNVIYRINSNDCDASYVGQTNRKLQISEHQNIRTL